MNSDILLVQPHQGDSVKNKTFFPGVEIPLNLTYLSAHLDREKISNKILDLRLFADPFLELEMMINRLDPRIVGISSYTSEIENAKSLSKLVKTINRNILVIIGGYHASAIPEQLLAESPHFDLLVHGEGELTLTEIFRKLENGSSFSDVDGLASRHNGSVILNG